MSEEGGEQIEVKVFRFNPAKDKEPRYVTYRVPFEEGMSVLNVLRRVYDVDSSLAFTYSCRIGRCGGCGVFVDGRGVLSCCTLASRDITIEPPISLGFKTAKDLVYYDDLNEQDYIHLPRWNAFHRFDKAYGRAK